MKDGNIKEKGVDALLVADLIYHAAQKNIDYAIVVTHDTDFVQPLKRVEDFGCRTSLVAMCFDASDRLKMACDNYLLADLQWLIKYHLIDLPWNDPTQLPVLETKLRIAFS
jgi:uncharacterized LabA/DUF88 family protein